MYIDSIEVENFRQLDKVTLSFEQDMTVLAGPNNSGKTTLINLLKKIFKSEAFKFGEDDIPVMEIDKWYGNVYEIFKENIKTDDTPEKNVTCIVNTIFQKDKEIIIPECKVKFKIDYSENDDLRNFMDYLMDLDENKHSFYFMVSFEVNANNFGKMILDNYGKLLSRFQNNDGDKNRNVIRDILVKLYATSIDQVCYFTDEKFKNETLMDTYQFRSLFNLEIIYAGRSLDEYGNTNGHNLSKKLISLASKDEKWKDFIKGLPDKVLLPIQQSEVGNEVKKTSTKVLNDTIEAMSKTSGTHAGTIELNMDMEEADIDSLLNRITCAKYSVGQYSFGESSQGLGYSNLIFMHIDLQKFLRTVDPNVVNLFFIEEPEAHMHPQMQRVFIKYLLTYYSESNIQGLITTHSNEIVKYCSIEKLRVIRMISQFKSEIFNLSAFKKNGNDYNQAADKKSKEEVLKQTEEATAGIEESVVEPEKTEEKVCVEKEAGDVLNNFYDWFFEIGYSDIIFADSAILYEGDTERLYIKRIITREKYASLQEKYIAFIQVGGAYAYNFKSLISYLKIKTLIITDIDYSTYPKTVEDILNSSSTNSTIIKFYCEDRFNTKSLPKDATLKIDDIYKWIKEKNNIVGKYRSVNNIEQELIYLAFQTEKDNYTRTLEAAMLAKLFGIEAYDEIERSVWIKKREVSGLKFSIPNNRTVNSKTGEKESDSKFTLRNILESTSNGKTDFMYSVIMSGLDEKMLPTYIQEGLEWLMK